MVETRSQRIAKEEEAEEDEAEKTNNNDNETSNSNGSSSEHDHQQNDEDKIISKSPSSDEQEQEQRPKEEEDEGVVRTSKIAIFFSVIILLITYLTLPDTLQPVGKPTIQHVWYFGWISAISTGLGVLPLIFAPEFDSYYVGVANAIAAGMMIAASYSLIAEGCYFDEPDDISGISSTTRTIIGSVLGLTFILSTKSFLERHEDVKLGSIAGADARRILLILFVMTLHSFSEGVGIGVSFGGSNGSELGVFISASLAVHNVPEGLAVAVVLLPQKVSTLTTALWCIMTSIPQPLMAVPAFLFVHQFIPILPVGLGFAGGAMAWVALFELLQEAYEDTDAITTGIVSSISLAVMVGVQGAIDQSSRS
mmetsp:Transcript_9778/g.9435  ORF Transcript_9778/g.9435 Transcript_9778/m.9435 type:complete len:366 (-) Transcript_9778:309-1406(-)|eukprot:CAMPEP_0197834166 /NCGR_PEP_ID=MMETSP1437-20131217/21403_1 /TAXON_ID=49252 ORGANISM="Eucampia antarctica, Strain CCMP1452" /NCGR_SAMPLE_ID=MMETSP1437 /ASSEMBLY_ACC=CAM_ASM_001096 /LENGTH=365 /DNA_ID=CAMNT_0043438653 /DNA_START=481 /DNA_END=1578 /DNA_ORIENTATION=-